MSKSEFPFRILAVDFDGTLVEDKFPGIGKPKWHVVNYVKQRKAAGDKIILWTSRGGHYLEAAVMWCKLRGIEFDAVNDDLPEVREYYGINSRKIYAHEYLDDRMIPFPEDPYHVTIPIQFSPYLDKNYFVDQLRGYVQRELSICSVCMFDDCNPLKVSDPVLSFDYVIPERNCGNVEGVSESGCKVELNEYGLERYREMRNPAIASYYARYGESMVILKLFLTEGISDD